MDPDPTGLAAATLTVVVNTEWEWNFNEDSGHVCLLFKKFVRYFPAFHFFFLCQRDPVLFQRTCYNFLSIVADNVICG